MSQTEATAASRGRIDELAKRFMATLPGQSLIFSATVPLDSRESLFIHAWNRIGAIETKFRWEEANLRPNQVVPAADVLIAELGEREALAGAMAVAALLCICGMSWVFAGFRQNRL